MQCDDLYQLRESAGIINFGGDIRSAGNLLRVNGHMQSALNSTLDGVGNVFIAGLPMQIDTLAWNTSGNTQWALEFLVDGQRLDTLYIHIGQPAGVVQLTNLIQLNAGLTFAIRVLNYWGPRPGPTQISLYASSL